LDLDDTALSHSVLVELTPALTRAKSLLSVHLDFNQGLADERLRKIFRRKMRVAKERESCTDVQVRREKEGVEKETI